MHLEIEIVDIIFENDKDDKVKKVVWVCKGVKQNGVFVAYPPFTEKVENAIKEVLT